MKRTLASHTLELHVDTPTLRAYYMREKPNSRMMSTYIIFSREGIVITGDFCPGRRGVVSSLGYGLEWFAGQLSEDYLCSKFLEKEWVPTEGYDDLRREILRDRRFDSISKKNAREAWDDLLLEDRESISADRAYEIFTDAGMQDFEIGHGYRPHDAEFLCAIQQRFAELYHAQQQPVAA
ncbi:MAG: hypothetical protein ACO1Q7_01995 [Gemmatimonas sp.]